MLAVAVRPKAERPILWLPPGGHSCVWGEMYICFIDESGGFEAPASNPSATPLMVIVGLIVDTGQIPETTDLLLHAKVDFFPQKCRSPRFLDHILSEVKGGDLRASLRSASRNNRRHAIGYLDRIVQILEQQRISLIGRVWIKGIGQPLEPAASYTYAIQDLAKHFQRFLDMRDSTGLVICDSRMHNQDSQVSHSVFTQKHRAAGDPLPRILEVPAFGSSGNHAGLQLADVAASALIFPVAARVYCAHQWPGGHTDIRFEAVRTRYAPRLSALQFRHQDRTGKWRGGVVVSDKLRRLPSARLFQL